MGSWLDAKRDPTENNYCLIPTKRYSTYDAGSLLDAYSQSVNIVKAAPGKESLRLKQKATAWDDQFLKAIIMPQIN